MCSMKMRPLAIGLSAHVQLFGSVQPRSACTPSLRSLDHHRHKHERHRRVPGQVVCGGAVTRCVSDERISFALHPLLAHPMPSIVFMAPCSPPAPRSPQTSTSMCEPAMPLDTTASKVLATSVPEETRPDVGAVPA